MIFSVYPRVVVKLGDERYEFDRASLMFKEVAEIETATGMSYGEWQAELSRYSIRAVAGLLHILRKRAGAASVFAAIDFSVDDLDVVPLHEDGSEFTRVELAEDIQRRVREAQEGPTSATAAPVADDVPPLEGSSSTSPSLPKSSTSAPSNGTSSRGTTSAGARRTLTPS